MKWPEYLMLIRHDVSAYNVLKKLKKENKLFLNFLDEYNRDPESDATQQLAKKVWELVRLGFGDHSTPLAPNEGHQAVETGKQLRKKFALPDVIFVSPYLRTRETLKLIKRGWPELEAVRVHEDERIREQEHGLALLYNDWRIFFALHPEQRHLHDLEGKYWYCYPQGENIPRVRSRNREWNTTLIREYAGKKVLAVTHHLNILAARANLERLDADEFIRLDEDEKPINCGVTLYRGNPMQGTDGRLELDFYNKRYYKTK